MKGKRIAIIGAGLSGLVVAQQLNNHNDVIIFEKSRGVGGRMATRRAENFNFDHGTQYFTAQSQEFKNFCIKMQDDGIIDIWNCRFAEISGAKIQRISNFNEKNDHFVAVPQMNSMCKYLANNVNVQCEVKISTISFHEQKWQLTDDKNNKYQEFDCIIFAIPSHQVVELLPTNYRYYNEIANIKMQGCFTMMIGLKNQIPMEFDAATVTNSILSWIAANNSKPQRNENFAITIHSNNQWADTHIDDDQENIKIQMLAEIQKILSFKIADINCLMLHRWRYANALKNEGQPAYFDTSINLGICGDYLISGRVESAFLSAKALVDKINMV